MIHDVVLCAFSPLQVDIIYSKGCAVFLRRPKKGKAPVTFTSLGLAPASVARRLVYHTNQYQSQVLNLLLRLQLLLQELQALRTSIRRLI